MRFPYRPFTTRRPVYPLGGSRTRHYPVFSVSVIGPTGTWPRDCLLNSGADDTIFPVTVAQRLGIDLTGAPQGESIQINGVVLPYSYASVTLRIADNKEACEWQTIVGFINLPLRRPLLGQTGFLHFFDVTLLGTDRAVVLTPNASFPGRHIIH